MGNAGLKGFSGIRNPVADKVTYLRTYFREKLSANRSYYVRTDGKDTNDGLSTSQAFLTVQKALDTVSSLDFSIYDVSIFCSATTRTVANIIYPWVGRGSLYIIGDESTPANCIQSVTGGNCFTVGGALPAPAYLRGFELRTTTTGSGISNEHNANVRFRNLRFGAIAYHSVTAGGGGSLISADGNFSITGNQGLTFADVSSSARVRIEGVTVTLSGTPNFGLSFAYTWRAGIFLPFGATFSGSGTGTRYTAISNSVIDTIGSGATFLPGNVGGSTASGGQYL